MSIFDRIKGGFGSGRKQPKPNQADANPDGLNLSPNGGSGATTLNKKPIVIAAAVLLAGGAVAYLGFENMGPPKISASGPRLVPGRTPDISIPPMPKPKTVVPSQAAVSTGWSGAAKPNPSVTTAPPSVQTAPAEQKESAQEKAAQAALNGNTTLQWSDDSAAARTAAPNVTTGTQTKSDGEAGAGVYDAHIVRRPASPYEIEAGNVIQAVLTTSIQSDLPGQISAMVSRNVYDSESGAYLLIPAGAKLVGIYSDKMIAGQTRVGVDWTRILMPNGSYVSIGQMPGTGPSGKDGLHDEVNNHTWEIFKNALLMSVVDLGISISQPGYASAGAYGQQAVTPAQTGEQSLAQTFGQAEAGILQKYTSIAPTLIIRSGYQMNVAVTKDIVFPGPYDPKPAALAQAPSGLAPAAIMNPYPSN